MGTCSFVMPRYTAILLALLVAATVRLAAETSGPVTTTKLEPQAPPAPVKAAVRSAWDVTTTLRGSVGWRNNVTVSAFHAIDRAFWRTEAEAFILRPIGTHWQFISFLNGDLLRYVDAPEGVAGEQQWLAHLETRWQPWSVLRAALKADGFVETTFIDPSQTEGVQQAPLRVNVRGGYTTFAPRVTLPWGFSVEPSFHAKRITYRGYNGHYNEVRPGIRMEWKHSERLVLSAAWFEHTRHYSELTQSTAGNRALRDWLLSLRQREGEIKASTKFDFRGTWTVAATVGRLENRDRAYGYLDYDQKRAQLECNWARGAWRATWGGEARRVDYLVQKVGVGIVRAARITDAYDATLRLERDLAAKWVIFAEERWERNRSNVEDEWSAHPFSYRTNTALLGVQRTF